MLLNVLLLDISLIYDIHFRDTSFQAFLILLNAEG